MAKNSEKKKLWGDMSSSDQASASDKEDFDLETQCSPKSNFQKTNINDANLLKKKGSKRIYKKFSNSESSTINTQIHEPTILNHEIPKLESSVWTPEMQEYKASNLNHPMINHKPSIVDIKIPKTDKSSHNLTIPMINEMSFENIQNEANQTFKFYLLNHIEILKLKNANIKNEGKQLLNTVLMLKENDKLTLKYLNDCREFIDNSKAKLNQHKKIIQYCKEVYESLDPGFNVTEFNSLLMSNFHANVLESNSQSSIKKCCQSEITESICRAIIIESNNDVSTAESNKLLTTSELNNQNLAASEAVDSDRWKTVNRLKQDKSNDDKLIKTINSKTIPCDKCDSEKFLDNKKKLIKIVTILKNSNWLKDSQWEILQEIIENIMKGGFLFPNDKKAISFQKKSIELVIWSLMNGIETNIKIHQNTEKISKIQKFLWKMINEAIYDPSLINPDRKLCSSPEYADSYCNHKSKSVNMIKAKISYEKEKEIIYNIYNAFNESKSYWINQ